ncbi:hypothetical protein A2U01_0054707 [Trifolium medium]|uniref:Uncharacterized protein n=1 Tax=Trifolium medium TaxID=97028 RepID=A0A392RCI1_9FABA|nr:hypothetical protein [Trifolium medium]
MKLKWEWIQWRNSWDLRRARLVRYGFVWEDERGKERWRKMLVVWQPMERWDWNEKREMERRSSVTASGVHVIEGL